MASGQPFLSLPAVPPLDLSMEDGMSALQFEQHDDSNTPSCTKPDAVQNKKETKPLTPRQSIGPAPSLRKSVSVDSFAQYGRESPVLSGPRPNRGNTSTALEPHRNLIYGISSSLKKEREEEAHANRNRGASTSTSKTGESSLQDLDLERSNTLNSSIERYRYNSFKPQDQAKPFLRAGELQTRPGRTPTISTASSLSSAVSDVTTSSSRLEDAPRALSSSSLQQLPRRGTVPSIAPTSRARSGSLGVYSSTPLRRPITSGPTFDIRNVDPTVTLVVVGCPGCGKSTVIRKGLKKFALSEPIACRTIAGIPGLFSITNYIRRTGRVGQLENVIDCPLKVLEASVLLPTVQSSSPIRNNPILDPVSRVDGVIVCYDASNSSSFVPVEKTLMDYSSMRIPILVVACKSDLAHRVDPAKAHGLCKLYDVGLIEVNHEVEKDRIGLAFEFLLQAVWRDRRDKRQGSDVKYRNPASPKLLKHSMLWHTSRSTTPVASSSPVITVNAASNDNPAAAVGGPIVQGPVSSTSPTVTISLNDSKNPGETINWKRGQPLPLFKPLTVKSDTHAENLPPAVAKGGAGASVRDTSAEKTEPRDKHLKPTFYMTLDELLDKLLFLAVSADDPSFITHFLLTYRRFATPRNVLLAMQKRMRQLDSPSGDAMFACFAQMRICALLEAWIKDYPYDFSVRGTSGALSALIKSILSKTYLLHYGSEFLPFLETLPSLKDDDSVWALKVDDVAETSDSEGALDDEEVPRSIDKGSSTSSVRTSTTQERAQPARERKSSLPLAKALKQAVVGSVNGHGSEPAEVSTKHKVKELVKLAHEVMLCDAGCVAQGITRLQVNLFLKIQPRHWLHLTFVGKNESSDSITTLISFSNHLAEWVLSLILCHEKPRNRARQVEKFVEIATKLRHLHNYSALRAFIAGIHGSTFPGDETMELFRTKCPEYYKSLQSWEALFRPLRSHRAYRMALRGSRSGCIPALEVHIQDLIRAHEGNPDTHVQDGSKIHWGKFNLIGKFIISTTQCQIQCRSAEEYNFPDRSDAVERLLQYPLMTEELRKLRVPPEYAESEDSAFKSQFSLPNVLPVLSPPQAGPFKATLPQSTPQTTSLQSVPVPTNASSLNSQPPQSMMDQHGLPKTSVPRPALANAPSQHLSLKSRLSESTSSNSGGSGGQDVRTVHELQCW